MNTKKRFNFLCRVQKLVYLLLFLRNHKRVLCQIQEPCEIWSSRCDCGLPVSFSYFDPFLTNYRTNWNNFLELCLWSGQYKIYFWLIDIKFVRIISYDFFVMRVMVFTQQNRPPQLAVSLLQAFTGSAIVLSVSFIFVIFLSGTKYKEVFYCLFIFVL